MTTRSKLLELREIALAIQPTSAQISFVREAISDNAMASFFFQSIEKLDWIDELHAYMKASAGNFWAFRQCYPYLFKIAQRDSNQFTKTVNAFGDSFDYYGYIQIIKIACSMTASDALNLLPSISSYFNREQRAPLGELSQYIIHISSNPHGVAPALSMIQRVISFRALPHEKCNSPMQSAFHKKSSPFFDAYAYKAFLSSAVKHLATIAARDTTLVLVDVTSEMLGLEFVAEDDSNQPYNDASEAWCQILDKVGEYENDPKADLIHALTNSFEFAFQSCGVDVIAELDGHLRKSKWHVFTRLRQHLYAKFPTDQTNPWIRELILTHEDYARWEHHYEFSQMIRRGCEVFGEKLLTELERTIIFDTILSGPEEEHARESMGEYFTPENFQKRRDHFHRKQLHPFARVLFGKYKKCYESLIAKTDHSLEDDDYSPVRMGRGGFVSYRSPSPPEEMAKLSDDELLAYINTWQESKRDPSDWLIEINISALASAFQTIVRQHILPIPARSGFWFGNREQIARPIYVRYLLQALQEEVKAGKFEHFERALDLCRWVLTKPAEPTSEDDENRANEESREHPAWDTVHRGVVDFVGICVGQDATTSLIYRTALAELLSTVCTRRDPRLDDKKSTFLNRRDPLSDAINNPRGIALENVIDLGYWIRRQTKEDPVPEVGKILNERLAVTQRLPLTAPEYTLLGRQFPNIITLDETWAQTHREVIFPKDKPQDWDDAFGTYLRFNNPYRRPFEILTADYLHALDQLDAATDDEDGKKGWNQSLGQHLFMFYVWGIYPLTGPESLLQRYYEKTKSHPKWWASLFDHAAHLLRNTKEDLDPALKNRLKVFAEWRLSQRNKEELAAYTFWLEGQCMDARWRLEIFSKVLDIAPGRDIGTSFKIDALSQLLPEQPTLVIECFAKLIVGLSKEDVIYIQTEKAKPILQAGLASTDIKVRQHAEDAREFLLRAACFDFLDL